MILEGYGIRLIRLREEHIETVRQWRNADHIRQEMQFREHITEDMQITWFMSIDNLENNYFLIEVEGKLIGLVNGAGIDWNALETRSGGIFVWDRTFWDTKYPMAASLLLMDLSVLCGFETTYAEILDSNKRAMAYNQLLGYKCIEPANANGASTYRLEHSVYVEKRQLLRDLFFADTRHEVPTVIIEFPEDPIEKFYAQKLTPLHESGDVVLKGVGNA